MSISKEQHSINAQEMTSVANKYRGVYIGTFIQIENIMADIVITVNHERDFLAYFKKNKMSSIIIEDFWVAFEQIKHLAHEDFIKNAEIIKSNIQVLLKYRNMFAHWMLLLEKSYIDDFDGTTVWLTSFHKNKKQLESINFIQVRELCLLIYKTAQDLILVQKSLYKSLNKKHPMD